MKVLMLTPRVNPKEDVFGFIYYWVKELGTRVDKLIVLTVKAGDRKYLKKLPENVIVYDMSERKGITRLMYAVKIILNSIIKEKIDIIFTHMYVEFVFFAAPFGKIFRKPIVMWYTHGHISWKVKFAHFLVNTVVTASQSSFRINSKKIIVTGHGIDTDLFKPVKKQKNDKKVILSVGRIDRVKDLKTLILAIHHLVSSIRARNITCIIVGPTYDKAYYNELVKIIRELKLDNIINFTPPLSNKEIASYYQKADVFISTSLTGSIDKAVLEAMSCEVPVVTCNEAFLEVFDCEMKEKCYFEKGDYIELARRIEYFINNKEKELRKKLRKIVIENHSYKKLANKLTEVFESVRR